MERAYNFSAGPAVLPEEVLREAADEMMNYHGSGMSVMEISHRSDLFDEIITAAEQDLRDLLSIPDHYKVLFIQGGGHVQFSMVPMNLLQGGCGDYILSGHWSKKAYQEALKFGPAHVIADSSDRNFSYVPDVSGLPVHEDADYVYYCMNNTIFGTRFREVPDSCGKPLVSDISSCFLSEPLDVSQFGILWGGVQKNIGPAGLAIAIVREDLIRDIPELPVMMKYSTYADSRSLFNTPPVYNIYICGKVFRWLKNMGGLEAVKQRNEEKAKILYDFLDSSELFHGTAERESRSLMNVTFVSDSKETDALAVRKAAEHNLLNLKGHRSVGGLRASIYNAMPKEGVEKLTAFLREFENDYRR